VVGEIERRLYEITEVNINTGEGLRCGRSWTSSAWRTQLKEKRIVTCGGPAGPL